MAFAAVAPFVMMAVQAAMSISQSIQAQRAADAQSKIAMDQAKLQAQQVEREGARVLSSDVAGAGKGGVVPTTGSPAAVYLQNARDIELRRLDELYAGKIGVFNARSRNAAQQGQIIGNLVGTLGKSFAGMYGASGTSGIPASDYAAYGRYNFLGAGVSSVTGPNYT